MRRGFLAGSIVILFLLQSWSVTFEQLTEQEFFQSYHEDVLFNQTGYYEDDVYTTTDGESHVSRPNIQWVLPNQGLVSLRTGACSVAIDSLDEVWLMGGRIDPNPSQSGDELPSDMIDIMNNANKTWQPAPTIMPHTQQYCEAEFVGDEIYLVGDWNRNTNPNQFPTGRVQIFSLTNNTWYNGTPMPSNNERGLGGMAEDNGYLYYAGGVRSSSGNDATNRTYRYDTANDQWSRMADMNQPRASFELINFHGQLYAMGGFQGTQTWNRQALDYVERYDPASDTWTNLSSLPNAMFGWGATVLNDEIILVGGYNGGTKKSVYHWNPLEDTWSAGTDIGSSGHFDLEVEEINGDIVWASGDMSTYPYSSWGQMFSADYEYQNKSDYHTGWITSPAIDLRPNANGSATPVQLELLGSTTPGGKLGFQYRAAANTISLSTMDWIGADGTANTTFPLGSIGLDLDDYADFIQYRIEMMVTDMPNWDEPNLDGMEIRAEHAAFLSSIPSILHPRAQTVYLQTSHDMSSSGEMYIGLASCDSSGSILGPYSRLSHDSTNFVESDTQGLFIQSSGVINYSVIGETVIDWSFDLGDLTGISFLCIKVGTDSAEITEFNHNSVMEIDNELEVRITDLGQFVNGDAIPGGMQLEVGLNHTFPSTGMTLSSGDIQARITFNTWVMDINTNNYTYWVNETTPWTDLTVGGSDIISWTPPVDISGRVDIVLESRSDQSFQMKSDSNLAWLVLDNDNPIIMSSIPANGDYVNSVSEREISLLLADTSGFENESMSLEIWVQGLDDGSDGSIPDAIAQDTEYRIVNHTLENNGSLWWFNCTQSDDMNLDHETVYLRILGDDIVGSTIQNNTISWQTRDARYSVIESISNQNQVQFWEVSRDISWDITISDANAISDVMSMRIELGSDSDFGITYDVADSSCSALDSRIDSDRTQCNHYYDGENMVIAVELFSGWEVERSSLDEGLVEIYLEDIDGINKTTFEDLWIYSEDFDFTIDLVEDVTGTVTGEVTNNSIVATGDDIQLSGTIIHSLSGLPYQGDLSITWWGLLQGQNWVGAGTITVVDGIIYTTIPMPITGGIMDMSVAFMDPWETRALGSYDAPVFIVDAAAPIILQSSTDGYSRYHLSSIGIGVNIIEEVSWTGELELTCQVISTDVQWPSINISKVPDTVFQGKTLFSYNFDFSQQGDPSQLSPEARIDCWAYGSDDAGWELISSTNESIIEPWISFPLSTVGPNIELAEVKLAGTPEPGKDIRVEITVVNSGESLEDGFNITVYTISNDEKTLVGKYSQAQIASGKGVTKLVSVTVPEGDWELLVTVDEEQKIWEINEEDNTFSKSYSGPEEFNIALYAGIGIGLMIILGIAIVLKRRGGNELSQAAKNLPSLDDLPRAGPPMSMRSKTEAKPKTQRKGPPPKPKPQETPAENNSVDISEAMAKLSLTTLPGNDSQSERVASYEELPGGGDYEYLDEGTFYSGESLGRWKLEEDGSFTKLE